MPHVNTKSKPQYEDDQDKRKLNKKKLLVLIFVYAFEKERAVDTYLALNCILTNTIHFQSCFMTCLSKIFLSRFLFKQWQQLHYDVSLFQCNVKSFTDRTRCTVLKINLDF